jgi:hypothetical protein
VAGRLAALTAKTCGDPWEALKTLRDEAAQAKGTGQIRRPPDET